MYYTTNAQIQIGQDIDGGENPTEAGIGMAISNNGQIMAIGTPFNRPLNSDTMVPPEGQVKVYENINNTWVQKGQDLNGLPFDVFGNRIALSANGNIMAAAAVNHYDATVGSLGAVRVFEFVNDSWVQIGSDILGEDFDQFGDSVAISHDGTIVAIGATFNQGVNGPSSGHVRVFENTNGQWLQIGDDLDGEAEFDRSGESVALSADGNIVAIGAGRNDGGITGGGHVRVYENIGDSWVQLGSDIDGLDNQGQLGASISLSANGQILVAGARNGSGEDGISNPGHVRVFQYNEDITTWEQIGDKISGQQANESFGVSVDISDDGSLIAVGGRFYDGIEGTATGLLQIYENVEGQWQQAGDNMEGQENNFLGSFMKFSGDGKFIAGSIFTQDSEENSIGLVRVFELPETLSSGNNLNLKNKIRVFPNPTYKNITLDFESIIGEIDATISNVLGQVITNERFVNTNTINLNINGSPGIYFVTLRTPEKYSKTLKIIKL
jgi:hypothetical protein